MHKERTASFRLGGFILGILAFITLGFDLVPLGLPEQARLAAAVISLMAIWWISLAVPLAITSLIPIAAFPLLGVMPSLQVTKFYANNNIFLFLGGFIIALAIERWGLHRRISLWLMMLFSGGPSIIVLGFICISALLSMWISNTATAMMMLPIGMAVVTRFSEKDPVAGHKFGPALMLAIAYGASIGGIGTPIGTPPNIEFAGQFAQRYPEAPPITFFRWLKVFLPLVIILLPLTWVVLTKIVFRFGKAKAVGRDVIRAQYRQLGPISPPEIRVLIMFICTAVLWIFRSNISIGGLTIPGWSNLFPQPGHLHDATVAMIMVILLFILPAGEKKRRQRLMNWETALKVPWGILILFGGGFAIAGAFAHTGLDRSIAGALQPIIGDIGLWPMMLIICVFVTFLTELTSNTATAATLIPIMAASGVAIGVNPLLLMIPATISASCAFMLPVATPPNAIAFGSGQISMGQMVRTGLILNIIIAVIVATYLNLALLPFWGMDTTLPVWVR